MAEARGKAQADTLRATKKDTPARVCATATRRRSPPAQLRKGDIVLIREGEIVPGDGEVIEGVAYVNEAAITGESAPVLKEPGTDIRSGVTGGTQVVSDWLKVRITANPGETFLDRMIALVEGAAAPEDAERDRAHDPAGLAQHHLPDGRRHAAAVRRLRGRPRHDRRPGGAARLPPADDDRRSPLGDRHRRHGPRDALQRPGDVRPRGRDLRRRRRAAARQDRHDHLRQPPGGRDRPGRRRHARRSAVKAALWSSLGDDTPEGKSIVALARQMGAALPRR